MKDRPSRDRGLVPTPAAHQKASCGCPTAAGHALGATEPGRPPQVGQIGTTGTFCRETLFELGEGSHIVLHGMTPVRSAWTGVKCLASFAYKKICNIALKIKCIGAWQCVSNVRADRALMAATRSRFRSYSCNADVTDSFNCSRVFKSSVASHDFKDHGNMGLTRSGCRGIAVIPFFGQ